MIAPTDDGVGRRDHALAVLEDRRERYLLAARRILLAVLLERGAASIDDVRDALPLPPGIDPRCVGPMHVPLVQAGIISEAAYVRSTRPVAHARRVITWRLLDRGAAERWLVEHPDRPDDDDQGDRVQATLWR